MPREMHDFRHRARQTENRRHPKAGEDDLLLRFDFEKVTGKLVSGDEYLVETRTVIGQHDQLICFSRYKQFSSDARIESKLTALITRALSRMGVSEDRFADIIDSVLVAIGTAESPMLPLDVGIWDITWFDERETNPTLVPAATSFIEGLERVRLVDLQDHVIRHTPSCAICLEDFGQQQQVEVLVTRLPCSHLYHLNCIVHCLERSNLCPMCRYPMPAQDQAS